MSTFSTDPFIAYVVAPAHHERLRRAADERHARHMFRRRTGGRTDS
jgi:hypothetical protein